VLFTDLEDVRVVTMQHIVLVLNRPDLDVISGYFNRVNVDVQEANVTDEPLIFGFCERVELLSKYDSLRSTGSRSD